MNKLIALVSFVVLSPLASATSPIVGPYVQKTLGKLGTAPWGQCRIYPHTVILQTSKRTSTPAAQKIDPKWMNGTIEEASKGQLKTAALHIMAAVPEVNVTAGVFMGSPTVADFTLYRDSSRVEKRDGKASAELLQLVDRLCVNLIAE